MKFIYIYTHTYLYIYLFMYFSLKLHETEKLPDKGWLHHGLWRSSGSALNFLVWAPETSENLKKIHMMEEKVITLD